MCRRRDSRKSSTLHSLDRTIDQATSCSRDQTVPNSHHIRVRFNDFLQQQSCGRRPYVIDRGDRISRKELSFQLCLYYMFIYVCLRLSIIIPCINCVLVMHQSSVDSDEDPDLKRFQCLFLIKCFNLRNLYLSYSLGH